MSILTTKNLTHTFPDGTTGIADISLQFGAGEFVIIAGANGSGKTVFIRHLNGLLTPTRGKVLIDGVPITKNITATRRKIGLIFQDSDSQIVGQTVAEDVAFGPENLNLSPPEVEQAVAEALRATGLEDLSKTREPCPADRKRNWPLPVCWRCSQRYSSLTSRSPAWIIPALSKSCSKLCSSIKRDTRFCWLRMSWKRSSPTLID